MPRWKGENWAFPPGIRCPARTASAVLKGDERWLLWLPRLLGVFAHLFAAINLSLAAWHQPAPSDWSWWA